MLVLSDKKGVNERGEGRSKAYLRRFRTPGKSPDTNPPPKTFVFLLATSGGRCVSSLSEISAAEAAPLIISWAL